MSLALGMKPCGVIVELCDCGELLSVELTTDMALMHSSPAYDVLMELHGAGTEWVTACLGCGSVPALVALQAAA